MPVALHQPAQPLPHQLLAAEGDGEAVGIAALLDEGSPWRGPITGQQREGLEPMGYHEVSNGKVAPVSASQIVMGQPLALKSGQQVVSGPSIAPLDPLDRHARLDVGSELEARL